jgi:integrase
MQGKALALKEDAMDSTQPATNPTVSEALLRVTKRYYLAGRRSARGVEQMIQLHLLPKFGERHLKDLTAEEIEDFAAERKRAGAKPAYINRNLFPLRVAFKLYRLPIPDFPFLEERNAREVFFERQEFERAVAELPPALRPPMWFAFFTGWRVISEVLRLRWDEHVRWEAGVVELQAAMVKGKQSRKFPFAVLPELDALMRTQRKQTPEGVPWVFHRFHGRQIRNFRKAWKNALEAAKLSYKIPHDLRRTAARNLILAGVPEKVVMQLVGWRSDAMLKRYHIVCEDDLREAVAKLAGRAG